MTEFVIVLTLLGAGVGFLAWLVLRLPARLGRNEVPQRLDELKAGLEGAFTRANSDMAARVEQVKGDLRTDLAERLRDGLNSVRETVDRQMADGRAEQSRRLGETVAALEQKFDHLRTGTETRLEQLAEKQSAAAREGRTELARVLTQSTQALETRFQSLEQRTTQHLDTIRARVDERLQAISDQVQAKLEKNIQEGFAHFQKVQEHLKAAEEQLRNVGAVGQSINELNSLLKLPHLRGKFGEAELGRLLADFLPAAAFEEQAVVVPGSREAVDAIVKFPRFKLPIDSKFNREQILPLFETSDPQQLEEARRQLAVAVKQQARSISEKYIRPEHGTTDLALMFLPSETIYFEVIRNGELLEAVHKLNVFPVSPNTLVITLRAIAMSISQYEFARSLEKTLEQIRAAQTSFGYFQKKFDEVGRGLEKAQEAYHTATGHLNRYANRVVRLTGEPTPELEPAQAEGEPAGAG